MDEITAVEVDGTVVGWVEYQPRGDQYRARLKGDSGSRAFHDRDEAVAWIRKNHTDTLQARSADPQ
jgi:predicted RNA-binding protein with PUA domain